VERKETKGLILKKKELLILKGKRVYEQKGDCLLPLEGGTLQRNRKKKRGGLRGRSLVFREEGY